jgi:ABC-2 type transport system ATP-binding protein
VAHIKGVARGDRQEKVNLAMEKCQLTEKRKVLIRKLSKGYKQRVGIAQAIVHDPPVIILDEPTVGLDPRQIIEVRNLIKSLAGTHTIILCSHILPEVSMVCDRITIINKGKVVATNTPTKLMSQLRGGIGYEIEIDGNPAQIQPLLQVIPGVCMVEIKHKNQYTSHNHSFLQITCEPDSEPGRDIAMVIVNVGMGLYEMRRFNPTLEDVFLELTTEEIIET